MSDAKTNFEELLKQEETLSFDRFSRADALNLGLLINEKAKVYSDPITIEITVNGLVVFRHFTDNSMPDSSFWLAAKRNSVDRMEMSSLRFMYWLEMTDQTLAGRQLKSDEYVACGGGFPINLRGTGVIGSICVSGLQNHLDDHQLIVDSLTEFLK